LIDLGSPIAVLSKSEFEIAFRSALDRTQKAFRKVELLQFYDESGDPSFDKLVAHDWVGAMAELDSIVEGQDELLTPALKRGVSLTRLRYVEVPLTDYVRWELASYRLSQEIGERIFISLNPEILRSIPECVMFDDHTLIALNYDAVGRFAKAQVFADQDRLQFLIHKFDGFETDAEPLNDFLELVDIIDVN